MSEKKWVLYCKTKNEMGILGTYKTFWEAEKRARTLNKGDVLDMSPYEKEVWGVRYYKDQPKPIEKDAYMDIMELAL